MQANADIRHVTHKLVDITARLSAAMLTRVSNSPAA
jgi:hypothetical protein